MNNEFIRMQKLAGLITESEYKAKKKALFEEVDKNEIKTQISRDINDLAKLPELQKLADAISKDPKGEEELKKLLSNINMNLNENVNIKSMVDKFFDLGLSKSKVEEDNTGGDAISGALLGFLGGGWLGDYLTKVPTTGLDKFFSEYYHDFGAASLGALAGAVIGIVAAIALSKMDKK